jgi:DNA-binding response OmpR family regulator
MSRRVLIIEDEPDMVRGLRDALRFEGFEVDSAYEGKLGVSKARADRPSLILLDLMLPDVNGYQVCEQIREFDGHVPIIMLTARAQEADKVRGLDAGADDYVTKPFSIAELLARIKAIFRRLDLPPSQPSQILQIGEARIDVAAQQVHKGRSSDVLSFYEVALICLLHDNAGKPVSRAAILERIWGLDAGPTNRTVDNFIVKLRRKVEADPKSPRHILTVYGQGYKLVP